MNSSKVADFYRVLPVVDKRIHILGMNAVGRFIAHSLRGVPNPPPITLIYHRRSDLYEWNESLQRIHVVTDGIAERRDGFDAELAIPKRRWHGKETGNELQDEGNEVGQQGEENEASVEDTPDLLEQESNEPIQSLIVSIKAPFVLSALSAVKHRIHPETVILFLQNGMGVVDQVTKEIFPDPETRPHYMVGINSHHLHPSPDNAFTSVHARFGTMALGLLPHERVRDPSAPYLPNEKFKPVYKEEPLQPVKARNPATPDLYTPPPQTANFTWSQNHRYLLRTLLRTPVFCATAYSPPDFLQLQLEKLALGSIINPLTVMLDARNGAILYNYSLTRVIRLLLSEISLVIRSLPELQYIPNLAQRFDPGRLETMVVSAAHRSRDNISGVLADVRRGRRTEIDYYNGWIVKRGEEQDVRCFMNYMMLNLVKGKQMMIGFEIGEGLPFVEPKTVEGGIEVRDMEASKEEEEEESEEGVPV
ncbi:hypothetical protein EJ04DRAFT_454090 [Polyplosphaeria fusca]|uniref:2-dehydropantoate 2-reductase n=1 Tax=Polyplosphaeria fusca TaxID=682080 RepID=A0A9P4RD77_9PLEO|nr:hypothetical protein EJ04DRAFT_454090 [Polyplosphaeria fusca]